MKLRQLILAMAIPLAAGIGCSDSGSSAPPVVDTTGDLDGQFLNFSGLTFTTSGGAEGTLGDDGEFTFFEGDIITLYLGGIKLGEAKAETWMTLLHFLDDATVSTSSTRVTDIMRFLMAVDNDDFFCNGLQVSEEARALAASLNYDFSDTDEPFNETGANSLVVAINKTKEYENTSKTPVTDIPASSATAELDSIIANVGPLVVHTTPTYRDDEDQNVLPLLDRIDVRFASSVQSETVDNNSFMVTDADGNGVDGSVVASGGLTASFIPDSILSSETEYTVTLSTSILDASDKPLPASYTFGFTTTAAQTTPVACIDPNALNLSIGTSGSSIVDINLSMMDCSGNAIAGLDVSDFNFFEGAGLDPVFNDDYETYRGYPDQGFVSTLTNTIILIDNSTSVSDTDFQNYVSDAKALIVSGVNDTSSLIEGQRVRIFTFDSSITEVTAGSYTQNTYTLADSLSTLEATRPVNASSTSFYGAINFAAATLGVPSSDRVKNTLIILSDAIDTSATSTLSAAAAAVDANDVNVYLLSRNADIDVMDALTFNLQDSTSAVQDDIAALKSKSVNYIDSLYSFQYASPKRIGAQDFTIEVIGNTNLTEDELVKVNAFDATGFAEETSVLRLIDDKQAVVVPTTSSLTVQAVSEFAAGSTSYSWTSDDALVATVTTGADQTMATINGVSAGSATLTINDNTNNLNHTVEVYVGDKYEWDFESNSLQGWSADAGWGNIPVTASERRNESDFAIGLPDATDADGLYAANIANSNFSSPSMDLTRFSGGNPVLEFKYKLRNADTGDTLRVEILDNTGTPTILTTFSAFTHDWTDSATINLSAYTGAGYDAAKIRFVFNSNASDEYEGVQLDDIKVFPTM